MEAAPEISPTRVLLVEDEIVDALLVQRSLRSAGAYGERFSLQHAATLAQAIEHLGRSAVDVMLLDLRLPDSEGPTTVARVREQDRSVPLVVVSRRDDAESVARAFEAGADEYLVKGDLGAGILLRRTIRHAIERRQARPPEAPEPPAPQRTDARHGLLHDLKNLHTSILGNAQILQREMKEEEGFLRQRVDALLAAARTAADLIRRLARGAEDAEETSGLLELSAFVRRAEPLLRGVLPEQVELRLDLDPDASAVDARPEALRRVLLELVANAAEAIGDAEGVVEVRTGRALLAPDQVPAAVVAAGTLAPGPHAWLEVRDDGEGLDGATRGRLFERGFSTRGPGRGHGLAQVREILARCGASLLVRSRPERGSAFRVLLRARG
jgi:signal transduction histidine kinase